MNPTKDSESWNPCPAGAIASLVKGTQKKKQKQKFQKYFNVTVLTCALLLIVSLPFLRNERDPSDHKVGGIYCSEVLSYVEKYKDQTISPEIRSKIDAHLAGCPKCRKKYEELSSELKSLKTNRELIAFVHKISHHENH